MSDTQTDIRYLTSGPLTLRTNDWELVAFIIAYHERYENLFDAIKLKMRALTTYPSGTTNVTVDVVTNGEAVELAAALLGNYREANASAIGRILTTLKAMPGQTWVNEQITEMQAREQVAFNERRQEGKRRLRKQ